MIFSESYILSKYVRQVHFIWYSKNNSSLHDVPPEYSYNNVSNLTLWVGFQYEIRFVGSHPMFPGDGVRWVESSLMCSSFVYNSAHILNGSLDVNLGMVVNMPEGSYKLCLDQNMTQVANARDEIIQYYTGQSSSIPSIRFGRRLQENWREVGNVGITAYFAPPPRAIQGFLYRRVFVFISRCDAGVVVYPKGWTIGVRSQRTRGSHLIRGDRPDPRGRVCTRLFTRCL